MLPRIVMPGAPPRRDHQRPVLSSRVPGTDRQTVPNGSHEERRGASPAPVRATEIVGCADFRFRPRCPSIRFTRPPRWCDTTPPTRRLAAGVCGLTSTRAAPSTRRRTRDLRPGRARTDRDWWRGTRPVSASADDFCSQKRSGWLQTPEGQGSRPSPAQPGVGPAAPRRPGALLPRLYRPSRRGLSPSAGWAA